MKKYLYIVFLAMAALLPRALGAQAEQQLLTVSGIVRDDNQRLPFVSVTIKGSALGTITNEDGYFSLKIPNTDKDITIVISHVGYYTNNLTVKATEAHEMRIFLKPYPNLLDPALIVVMDPESLVREALWKVRDNYPSSPVRQRGFYRETARKGNRYISVSEAVVDMYKYGYSKPPVYDRVEIIKGRRLMRQKSVDTLAVKLQGGPVMPLDHDVVKNPDDLFFEDDLASYTYTMADPTVIDQRPVYVVNMTPRFRNNKYPLYNAKVYIDKETLTIMRVENSVDMSDPLLVTNSILVKKPSGMKFEARDVSFITSYRILDGKAVVNYIRGSIEFRCDWKKRLFSSAYTVVTEMVATDTQTDNPPAIPLKNTFKGGEAFYDKVDDFADPDFWGDYNILEPSESLEHAVDRLRRRVSKM